MDRRPRWTTVWLATMGENRRSRDGVVVSMKLGGWNEIIKWALHTETLIWENRQKEIDIAWSNNQLG